jgi:hypothetical protein
VRVGKRRVRPRQSVGLHAHITDEALGFEDGTMELAVDGTLSNGEAYAATIEIPSAFTLLLMKLFAFRDRCQDEDKDLGRHHALDLYRIIAMMSEHEWEQTTQRIGQSSEHAVIVEAGRIIRAQFGATDALGCLRLQEHPLWADDMPLSEFSAALAELFG